MHEGHADIGAEALRRPPAHGSGKHHDHGHHGHDHGDDDGHLGGAHGPHGAAHADARAITIRVPMWWVRLTTTYRAFLLPALLIVLSLASWHGGVNDLVGFDVAIVAVALGLLVIGRQTIQEVMRMRRITAGVLVTIALIATITVEHFIAGAVVAIMMLLGEALESLTLARTRDSIAKLMDLTPPRARVKHGDHYHDVPVEQVEVGDVLGVFVGERLPVDGVIVDGQSALDQSAVTGESIPVDRGPGETVFSGTMNLSGPLEVRATAVGEDATVGKIIAVVRDAQAKKGPAQKIADRFAGWFTPLVLGLGTLTFLAWWRVFPGFVPDGANPLSFGLLAGVSVLVIACPCALVLATPTAVVAAVGNAARRGALIKGGVTIEKLAGVDTVALDKTGTLTSGRPQVVAVHAFQGSSEDDVLALAATVERTSRHPLAQAIAAAAPSGMPLEASDVLEIPGRGMTATVANEAVVVGTTRLLEESAVRIGEPALQTAREFEAKGWTSVWVAVSGRPLGVIALGDTIRPGAAEFLRDLKELGIREIVLLTGDNRGAAEHVARELGIDRVFSGLLPTEKSDAIAKLQREGRRVAMVGDGINDGPALAVSDVGIAMGAAGSDIAIDTADIALLGDRLEAVPEVVHISRRAFGVIRQNIYLFALAANVGGMALASLGILTPVMAALVHNASSIFVVGNSARLLGARRS